MAKHRKILLNCSRRMLRNPGVSPPAARSMVFHRLEDRKLLSGTASDPQAAHDLFNLSPALFVENQGQWEESSVRYAFQRPGANILFTDEGPVFELYRAINAPERSGSDGRFERDPLADRRAEPVEIEALRFQTLFEGANAVRPVALNQAETVINYFVGDESEWRADVPTYTTIVYFGLWEGIDLYLSGQQGSLKYEFHVAPEADWRAIRVEWEGIEGMSLSEDGDLIIDTPLGTISDSAPVLWQVIDGANAPVGGQYRLLDERTYGFEVTSPYDAQRALVIDPEVEWMMYLGGSSSERAMSVAADRHNSMLITGYTFSADFSGRNNSYYGGFQQSDAFVAKLSHTGTLLWMLYLGGTSADYGRGISVDSSGNAFLTGTTLSSDFVGRNNAYSGSYEDAFVAKVSTAGSVLWMTYLQGAPGTNDNYGISIAADALGHSFTTGYENTQNGAAAFITKVSPGGIAQWTTYLGAAMKTLAGASHSMALEMRL